MKKKRTKKTGNLEKQYKKYFVQAPVSRDFSGGNRSLRQPSYLDVVNTFTTCGISEDMLIQKV